VLCLLDWKRLLPGIGRIDNPSHFSSLVVGLLHFVQAPNIGLMSGWFSDSVDKAVLVPIVLQLMLPVVWVPIVLQRVLLLELLRLLPLYLGILQSCVLALHSNDIIP
jgi:ABC-type dipeptide/oligopeptide/nickel transport system permease subunit